MSIKGFSLHPKHVGVSLVDRETPVSFGIGYLAGAMGISPSYAALGILSYKAIAVAVEKGDVEAAFKTSSPQTYGNRAVDLIMVILGVHFGSRVRKQKAAASGVPICA